MRTKFRLYAVVLAIVACGVMAFGATAAAASGKGKTLRLAATENQSEFLDLGTPGPSLGDELIISETLMKHGRDVGTSGIVCVVTEATPPYDVLTLHCVATLSLDDRGQITLQGLIEVQTMDEMGSFTVAITGGTGAFRGASGEAFIRDVSETTTIYKLSFDKGFKHGRHHSHKKKHHR